jgi:hypothetical protein
LRDGLCGRNSDPGAVVASRTGANENGGEVFVSGEFFQEGMERGEKVTLLGAFAGEGFFRYDFAIPGQREGGPGHAGFEGKKPVCPHKAILMRQLTISN